MPEQTTRNLKLTQFLNEAYGKEKELETSLQAHIAMTTKAPYKKRLQQHLKETKAHARQVERRIKQLGGQADLSPAPGPIGDAATAVTSVASKAVAAAKGPLHTLRGTGESEIMLKNARTEYSEEFQEIAHYTSIEALADAVGDKETAKLARDIRREEERMAKFLAGQIPTLAKAVAREEIPASERSTSSATRRRSGGSSSSRSSSSSSRSTGSRSSGSGSGSSGSRSGGAAKSRSRSGSSRSSGGSASARSSGAAKSRSSSGSSRSSGGSKSRSTGSASKSSNGRSGSRSGGTTRRRSSRSA
jgi:ferritin-like metal-binding protein YciE